MERNEIEYQKKVEVGGAKYLIHAMTPSAAWKLGVRVAKIAGEPMAAAAEGAGNADKALEVMPMAIRALLTNLDPDQSLALIKELLECVEVVGDESLFLKDKGAFDSHFQKRLGAMAKVVAAVVEFQFEDFFDEIRDAISTMFEKKKGLEVKPKKTA